MRDRYANTSDQVEEDVSDSVTYFGNPFFFTQL